MADLVVRVVDRAGTVINTLENAEFSQATWELNGPGSMDFDLHNYDPDAIDVQLISREVQVLRDGTLIWWGVPVRTEATPTRVRVSCRGLLWYFGRRYIGRADRTNLLANPEFESGLTSWTATNTTATADTTQRILGTQSAKLVQSTANQDAYLTQTVTVTGTEVGTLLTLVGWYRVSDAGWVGGALGDRGLFVLRKVGGTPQETKDYSVDSDTPRDSWQRAEITTWVPPNETNDLEIRLYSPGGTIHWDALSFTAMESLSNYNTDQTEIARQIVVHLQDTAYGKSALNIGTSTPASGVLRDRHYQHADHHNGLRALEEFSELSDGFDFDITYTTTTRTFTTYSPRKGGTPAALDFAATGLSDWVLRMDGEHAASAITLLGDGDGPDREEGAATDTTVFGGVTVEDVVASPPGTSIDALDAIAVEELRLRKTAKVLTATVPASGFIGSVVVGDKGTPVLSEGYSVVTGDWRLIRMTLDADDSLSMELNPA